MTTVTTRSGAPTGRSLAAGLSIETRVETEVDFDGTMYRTEFADVLRLEREHGTATVTVEAFREEPVSVGIDVRESDFTADEARTIAKALLRAAEIVDACTGWSAVTR